MKRFFIAVALTVACAPAFAQEVVGLQEAQTRRGPYLTNRLFDNIFISVAGGINIYEGENVTAVSALRRLWTWLSVNGSLRAWDCVCSIRA